MTVLNINTEVLSVENKFIRQILNPEEHVYKTP